MPRRRRGEARRGAHCALARWLAWMNVFESHDGCLDIVCSLSLPLSVPALRPHHWSECELESRVIYCSSVTRALLVLEHGPALAPRLIALELDRAHCINTRRTAAAVAPADVDPAAAAARDEGTEVAVMVARERARMATATSRHDRRGVSGAARKSPRQRRRRRRPRAQSDRRPIRPPCPADAERRVACAWSATPSRRCAGEVRAGPLAML